MIEQLFGSKTRVKLLHLFYGNPNRPFYVREITRKIDEQINSVRRELANLLNVGIIKSDTVNNKLYYEVNQEYEYFKPFSQVFGNAPIATEEPTAEQKEEAVELKALGNVELIILTGQFTRDERSGVDLLAVGDLNPTQMAKFVKELEEKENKEIRYASMTPDEYTYRQNINDRFLSLVLASKHQLMVDNRIKSRPKKAKQTEEKEEE